MEGWPIIEIPREVSGGCTYFDGGFRQGKPIVLARGVGIDNHGFIGEGFPSWGLNSDTGITEAL